MAIELNEPGRYPGLPFSKYGSEIGRFGIKLNKYTEGTPTHPEWHGWISGWTQLNGSEEVPGQPMVSFTQKDSPRKGGEVVVYVYYNVDGSLPLPDKELFFQIYVRECSNGHKFWLNQTMTIVYTVTTYYGEEEEVTFTYTLTDADFQLTPTPPTYIPDFGGGNSIYYGYQPYTGPNSGGSYTGLIVDTISVSESVSYVTMKSIEVTPHNFFQPPGDYHPPLSRLKPYFSRNK